MYSRSMKGSLMALISTLLLRKAFLNTYHNISVKDKEINKKWLGKSYNTTDTAKSVDSDVDCHFRDFIEMNWVSKDDVLMELLVWMKGSWSCVEEFMFELGGWREGDVNLFSTTHKNTSICPCNIGISRIMMTQPRILISILVLKSRLKRDTFLRTENVGTNSSQRLFRFVRNGDWAKLQGQMFLWFSISKSKESRGSIW